MRSRVLALFVAALGLALLPMAAEAKHRRHHNHGGYYTKTEFYHRHHRSDFEYDRFAYYESPRRYYPYYNSGYWRPTVELRYRRACCRPVAMLPPYYQAWGYPRPVYRLKHRKWHRYDRD